MRPWAGVPWLALAIVFCCREISSSSRTSRTYFLLSPGSDGDTFQVHAVREDGATHVRMAHTSSPLIQPLAHPPNLYEGQACRHADYAGEHYR